MSSRSRVAEQVAAHRATLPFLEGSKPPFKLAAAKSPEDSFFNATIKELAAFVLKTLEGHSEDVFGTDDRLDSHFFIFDEETVREGSMIIVSFTRLVERDDEEDSESDEEEVIDSHDVHGQRSRLAAEKVGMKEGKKIVAKADLFNEDKGSTEGFIKFTVLRMGIAHGSTWAECMEKTGKDLINVLRMSCSKDGVYWGDGFEGTDPPPMEERCGMSRTE